MPYARGQRGRRVETMLRDAQFWVPVVVLVLGLVVLWWIR